MLKANIHTKHPTFRRKLVMDTLAIMILFCCLTAISQERGKKTYADHLDSLWSKDLTLRGLSNDGNWVMFNESYDKKGDTLRLYQTTGHTKLKFPSVGYGRLSGDSNWFSTVSPNQELFLVNLNDLSTTTFKGVSKYDLSKSSKYLAIMTSQSGAEKRLTIKNLQTMDSIKVLETIGYVWHPHKNKLLLNIQSGRKHTLWHFNMDTGVRRKVMEAEDMSFHDIVWSGSGNAFAFLGQSVKNQIAIHYIRDNGEVQTLSDTKLGRAFPGHRMAFNRLRLSDDGHKLYFSKIPATIAEALKGPDNVEVWDTGAPLVYPHMSLYKKLVLQYQLTVWQPAKDSLLEIANALRPSAIVDPNHPYALSYNQLANEPSYMPEETVDFYATNTETGTSKKIIEGQYTGYNFVKISPSGRYVTYFKDKNWWLYDMATELTLMLTKGMEGPFEDIENDMDTVKPPYGNPGWFPDESAIIIYDQFDIWSMAPDGSKKKRWTKGKEVKRTFRIDKSIAPHSGYFSDSIDLHSTVLLTVKDENQNSGYWKIDDGLSPTELVYGPKKHEKALISKNGRQWVHTSESYRQPPRIQWHNIRSNTSGTVYQSNAQLLDYDLGKATLIHYKTPEGRSLKGVLIHPADFDQKKKYPMVVHIYEKMSSLLHDFNAPTEYNIRAFNPMKYAANGYFLFYPDIEFTIGKPGMSILECITAGVGAVVSAGHVDPERIGLIGQSFGGYGTLFTVTHTDIFAAAVAGASITDFTSRYHAIGSDRRPEMYRFENKQHRMGGSFYDLKEAYGLNSPLSAVENLNTPVLLWSGKEDNHVQWTQSVMFFLGMKRLNKEGQLLLYKNEEHALRGEENQKHLSNQVMAWWDTHLKG